MRKKILILLFIGILSVCALVLYRSSEDRSTTASKAYGNVDIRQSTLAFDRAGRITALLADEGDLVKKDQILARLDTVALEHQITIKKEQCITYKAKYDELKNGYQSEEIQMARAQVETFENSLRLARITYNRFQNLFDKKSVSAQDRDNAYYTMKETAAALGIAKARLDMLENGYRDEQILAAKANFDSCQSSLEYLHYQKDRESVIKAPFDGQVRTRLKEPGDVITTSSGVFELSQITQKRVRCYLTESQLSLVKTGNKAVVITSAGERITGQIAFISSTAMFTPKTVQTEELRADLVYEVRVDITDEDNTLRQGQPVTVEL